jgi:hypothetical protein
MSYSMLTSTESSEAGTTSVPSLGLPLHWLVGFTVLLLDEVSTALGRVVVRVILSIALPLARLLEHVEPGSRGAGESGEKECGEVTEHKESVTE